MTPEQRQAWLEERRTGIGSSDAAAVCGLSPWSTALHVYLDKLGQLPEFPMTPAMKWGLRLESAIAEEYAERTGFGLSAPALQRHRELPFVLASVDRVRDDGRIVELKTARVKGDEWGEPGTDFVPTNYLIQVTHQMLVTGSDVADIAVLFGGSEFEIYTVGLDGKLAAHLLAREIEFWENHVARKQAPEPDWNCSATAALVERICRPAGGEVLLPDSAHALVDEWEAAKGLEREWAGRKEMAKAKLSAALGTASVGMFANGRVVDRRLVNVKASTREVKAYQYQRITVKEPAAASGAA